MLSFLTLLHTHLQITELRRLLLLNVAISISSCLLECRTCQENMRLNVWYDAECFTWCNSMGKKILSLIQWNTRIDSLDSFSKIWYEGDSKVKNRLSMAPCLRKLIYNLGFYFSEFHFLKTYSAHSTALKVPRKSSSISPWTALAAVHFSLLWMGIWASRF